MVKEKSMKLEVGEANLEDIGRSIARIDKSIMVKQGINEGEYIQLCGRRKAIFIAAHARPADVGLSVVRIDGIGRKNTEASIGDKIIVIKIIPKPAKEVVVAPAKIGVKVTAPESMYKEGFMGKCVQKGDMISLKGIKKTKKSLGTEGLFDELFSGMENNMFGFAMDIKFIIINTKPEGSVVINRSTKIIAKKESPSVLGNKLTVTYDDIGGMEEEIRRIREMVELPLRHPEVFDRLGIRPPKGLLLHGPPGTGKTLLAKAVASETNCYFKLINGPEIMSHYYGGSESNLRKIFQDAAHNSPAIIFIDEIDAIAPNRDSLGPGGGPEARVVAQLLALMDGLKTRGNVVVIAATNRPNTIDPALRRPGRFDREILIGVPNEEARNKILKIHSRNMPLDKVDIDAWASRTYGFVGADLESLCRESAMAILREFLPKLKVSENEPIPDNILKQMVIKEKHFEEARRLVNPSAMREVMIERPSVGWNDVGGLEDIKRQLIEAIEWPMKYPDKFKKVGIRPPKGVLLYGPPGVGKTLLGRAVARECKSNFILVKGPELFSMWVGESEKNIRKIFQRARTVSPAIIFFDEIDSLAATRGNDSGSGVGDKVVNQLLTELDGLEEIKGIIVLASTNRPDRIDPGLLRPGRFDKIIYTPIPSKKARFQILKIYLRKMNISKDIDIKELLELTEGFVGADIEVLCMEAGMLAMREDMEKCEVNFKHFKAALEIVYPSVTPETEKLYTEFSKQFRKQRTKEAQDELKKVINYVG